MVITNIYVFVEVIRITLYPFSMFSCFSRIKWSFFSDLNIKLLSKHIIVLNLKLKNC